LKEIQVSRLTETIRQLCIDANYYIGDDVVSKIKEALPKEDSPIAREILQLILKNQVLAADNKMPMCQDTGVAIVFVEIGQDVHLIGGDFSAAINEGVRQGYIQGYLRKSMVDDPVIDRINTKDNTPALIYTDIVPGNTIKITLAAKGGGAENMSEVKMMKAADGIEGVKAFIVDRVRRSGGNPCPPIIVGVGIGGSFEHSAFLAKKSLLRPLIENNPDTKWAQIEKELLEQINRLGIGPQGLGGRTTALAVNILTKPCHIASMPVAVNMQCHCHRHKSAVIS
jgi:fumarate hydratase subunit alpha